MLRLITILAAGLTASIALSPAAVADEWKDAEAADVCSAVDQGKSIPGYAQLMYNHMENSGFKDKWESVFGSSTQMPIEEYQQQLSESALGECPSKLSDSMIPIPDFRNRTCAGMGRGYTPDQVMDLWQELYPGYSENRGSPGLPHTYWAPPVFEAIQSRCPEHYRP